MFSAMFNVPCARSPAHLSPLLAEVWPWPHCMLRLGCTVEWMNGLSREGMSEWMGYRAQDLLPGGPRGWSLSWHQIQRWSVQGLPQNLSLIWGSSSCWELSPFILGLPQPVRWRFSFLSQFSLLSLLAFVPQCTELPRCSGLSALIDARWTAPADVFVLVFS